MSGRFVPPDHAAGDANTIGGYAAVHGRPAAFEGSDGLSYSVELETDRVDHDRGAWGAYFLFLRWRRLGQQGVEGHLESDFLAYGATASEARAALGTMALREVREVLERLIAAQPKAATRRWYDAMRDDDPTHD